MNLFRTLGAAALLALGWAGTSSCIKAPDYPVVPTITFNQIKSIYAPPTAQSSTPGDTIVFIIKKENLYKLYNECSKYETFGRLMAEQVAQRATEIAMSLSSDKPEERFQNLLKKQPNLFMRVPQKYIANFLGVGAESLSRIRSRIISKEKNVK